MGLDLRLISREYFLKDIILNASIDEELKNTLNNLMISGNIEKAGVILSLSLKNEERYIVELYNHIFSKKNESFFKSSECKELYKKYRWILYDKKIAGQSRVGTYSAIHYLRYFADRLFDDLGEKKEASKEIVYNIIRDICFGANYGLDNCPALCNHSDSNGYYLPTTEPYSFEYGSSVQLLRELDRIYSTGAIKILQDNLNAKIDDYAGTIIWVFKILLCYALRSVADRNVLIFC